MLPTHSISDGVPCTPQEFIELTKTINNANPTFPGNYQRALEEFDRNDDGLIDFDEFRELNRRYPVGGL